MAYVQSANNRHATGPVTCAYGSNVTAGALLLIAVLFEDITTAISTLTDTRSNTYQQAGTILRTSANLGLQIYYAWNSSAGANTVTATPTASAPITIAVHEYSGMMTAADPLDVTAGATGTNDTPLSGSLTTTVASDLLFAFAVNNRSQLTAGSGYADRESFAFNYFGDTEDQTAGAAGSYSAATSVMSSSGQWAIRLAAFKPPAAGGASSSRNLVLLGVG